MHSSFPAERTIGKKLQAGGRGRRSVAGFLSPCVQFPDSATSHDFTSIKSKRGRGRKKRKKKKERGKKENGSRAGFLAPLHRSSWSTLLGCFLPRYCMLWSIDIDPRGCLTFLGLCHWQWHPYSLSKSIWKTLLRKRETREIRKRLSEAFKKPKRKRKKKERKKTQDAKGTTSNNVTASLFEAHH